MNIKKYIIILFTVMICFTNVKSKSFEVPHLIQNQINKLYSNKFDIDIKDLRINVLHFPNLVDISFNDILIDNSFKQIKLGHHTIKIKLMKNQNEVGTYPVTLVSSIIIDTPISNSKIKHGKKINSNLYEIGKVEIKNNYDDYYRINEIPENLVTKKMIHENEVIRKSYLRPKPDVKRGEKITLHLISGDILIKMNGVANNEGTVGDKIKVFCQATRRHFFGIIETPQLVVINIEN